MRQYKKIVSHYFIILIVYLSTGLAKPDGLKSLISTACSKRYYQYRTNALALRVDVRSSSKYITAPC
jgi:hypothetical protein